MRAAAEAVAARDAALFCAHGITEGDAFALATRFDCGWVYRGRQALFWRATFAAHDVHDRYLPGALLRPFDRRGLLNVAGTLEGTHLSLAATQFAGERRSYVRELRVTRATLRATDGAALLFITGKMAGSASFADLGFTPLVQEGATLILARAVHATAAIVRV
jgi:hypothetical protein